MVCLVFKIRLNVDTDVPIYRQIMAEIERSIARGDLEPGDRLPSQREMAVLSSTNPNTVQRAYRELEVGGVIETRRGQGTFVSEHPGVAEDIRKRLAGDAVDGFVGEMKSLGLDGGTIARLVIERLDREEGEEERSVDGEGSESE